MSSSQNNKCLNEKRRREQEKVYIEELAELISEWLADMNSLSVKPDKCAILQETLKQMRIIKQESEKNDDLQAAEVSSSKPNIIASDVLGPLLLEALDGFLLVINYKGIIEYVSENVSMYLKYKKNKLVSKSIYDIVHKEDHLEFKTILLNTFLNNDWSSNNLHAVDSQSANFNQNNVTISASSSCSSTSTQSNKNHGSKLESGSKSKMFNARFKIKPILKSKRNEQLLNDFLINQNQNNCELIEEDDGDDDDEDEIKNELSSNLLCLDAENQFTSSLQLGLENNDFKETNYLNLQISAILSTLPKTNDQKFNGNNSSNNNLNNQKNALVCVARRLPVNKSESSLPVDQFSTKLDLDGTIRDLDTTGMPLNLETYIQNIKNKKLQNLVAPKYYPDIINYLRKVSESNNSLISEKFELNISEKLSIVVRMKLMKIDNYIIGTLFLIKPISQDNIQNLSNLNTSEQIQYKSIQVHQVQLSQQNQFQKNQITTKQIDIENSVNSSPSSQTPNVSIFSSKSSTLQSSTSSSGSISEHHVSSLFSSTPSLVSSCSTSDVSTVVTTVAASLQNNLCQNNQSINSQKTFPKNNENSSDFTNSTVKSNSTSAFNTNNITQNSDSNLSTMELFNNCLNISYLFPTSNWMDYETNSNEKTSNNLDFNTESLPGSNTQNLNHMSQNQQDSSQQQTDKLRSLLTQTSEVDSSPDNIFAQSESFSSPFSIHLSDTTTQSTNTKDSIKQSKNFNNLQNTLQTNSGHQTNSNNQSNTMLRAILNQDDNDDFCLSSSRSPSSISNFNSLNFNNSTNSNLESLFERCNTFSTSSTVSSPVLTTINNNITESNTNSNLKKNKPVTNTSTSTSPISSNTGTITSTLTSNTRSNKGNNMLRKLLNDDDLNKSFCKGKDVLIQQLLRETNSLSPTASLENSISDPNTSVNTCSKNVSSASTSTSSSTNTNSTRKNLNDFSKFGSIKRKSNDDHFTNNSLVNHQNTNSTFLNLSNNSCFSNSLSSSQPGTPSQLDNGLESYPSAKRLSLSEPLSRPSSTPSTSSIAGRPQQQHLQYSNSNVQVNSNVLLTSISTNLSNQSFTNQQSSTSHHSQSLNGTLSNANQQPQQLAGQNPMLAQMLAQTPKTLPVPTIITTEIVSQVPQDRLPKNLEKKLIHTPATTNSQYSTQINQFENYPHNVTSNLNTSIGNVSSLLTITSNTNSQSNQQIQSQQKPYSRQQQLQLQQQSQHQSKQFIVNNNRDSLQQMKNAQVMPRKFLQSSDQQPQLQQHNLLNSNQQHQQQQIQQHHPIQMSNQCLNKMIVTPSSSVNINDNKGHSVLGITGQQQNVSVVLNNTNAFLMNNQMQIINTGGSNNLSSNHTLQISSSNVQSSSFYSERTTSSSNVSTINMGSTYTNATSSSKNVTLSSIMANNLNSCAPSSSIDSNNLNHMNSIGNSISNTPIISSTVVGSPNSASNSEDTLLLKILDEFANPDSPTHGTSSPTLISSTTLQQFRSNITSNTSMSNSPCNLNEKLAISEIQKQLMSFDTNNIGTNNNNVNSLSQTQSLLTTNTNTQIMPTNNNNVGVATNSFGPPPAYQTATQQTQNINLNSSPTNNQMLCGMQRSIIIPSQQTNCRDTQRLNNTSVMSPRMNLVSSNNMTSNYVQQPRSNTNNMINNMTSNTNSSTLNTIAGSVSSPQMMQISNNNTSTINQRIPKGLLDRKQKIQYNQQINNKRFIPQLPTASLQQQTSQSGAGQQDADMCMNNLHQGQYDSLQQTNNSSQPQQAQTIMMNLNTSSLPTVQRSNIAKNSLNDTKTGVAATSFTSSYLNSSSQPSQSPHLQISHRDISSPHSFSPSSPASTTIHHHNQQQNSQQPQSQISFVPPSSNSSQQKIQTQSNVALPVNNNCWPVSVQLHANSTIGINANNGNTNNLINVTSSLPSNRIQQQNPMLNAQLSQGSISYIQTHTTPNSQQSNSSLNQTILPPSTSSPPLVNNPNVSMRFNRNSPILTSAGNQQYPPSPSFHNISSPATPPMQQVNLTNRTVQTSTIQQRVPQANVMQARPVGTSRLTINDNNVVNTGQVYYQSDTSNIGNRNMNSGVSQQQTSQHQQQTNQYNQYANCVMTNNNVVANNKNASSEYVRQKVRAKIDARNPQQQNIVNTLPVQIQARPQLPTLQSQQKIQQQNLSQIQQQNVQHVSVQQSTNSQHRTILNQTYTPQPIISQQQQQQQRQQPPPPHPPLQQPVSISSQLDSSLTAEDFDAMCVGLELSDQIVENSESSLFNFGDLSESNTIDDLDLGNNLSIINNNSSNDNNNNSSVNNGGNIRNQSNNGSRNAVNNNTNQFQQQPQSQQQNRNKQKGSLLQQLLSEPT